jgi:outer membrane protein OmpA-like peptidoglycan-associated protein
MRNGQLAVIVAALGLAAGGVAGPGAARATDPARAANSAAPAARAAGSSSKSATRAAAEQLSAQEEKLRTSLAQTAAVVVHADNAIELLYPVRLAFVPDGNELLPTGAALLDLVAKSLREYAHSEVVVAVYTDAIGNSDYNQGQSQARATVLVEELESRGIAAARLVARGMGESAQLEAPATPEGRDLNRRVQFVITPLSS